MIDRCKNCRRPADPGNARACRFVNCGLSLHLSGPERFRRRYQAQLQQDLPPEVLYHCFTGETDEYELARIANLDHVLQSSLLAKVERLWPDRLAQIADARRTEQQESKAAVQQFVLNLTHDQDH
jgi:hypothetical protein